EAIFIRSINNPQQRWTIPRARAWELQWQPAALGSPVAIPSPGTTSMHGLVYSLLADNRLIAVRASDAQFLADYPLAPPPAPGTYRAATHVLARSKDGQRLFA